MALLALLLALTSGEIRFDKQNARCARCLPSLWREGPGISGRGCLPAGVLLSTGDQTAVPVDDDKRQWCASHRGEMTQQAERVVPCSPDIPCYRASAV